MEADLCELWNKNDSTGIPWRREKVLGMRELSAMSEGDEFGGKNFGVIRLEFKVPHAFVCERFEFCFVCCMIGMGLHFGFESGIIQYVKTNRLKDSHEP